MQVAIQSVLNSHRKFSRPSCHVASRALDRSRAVGWLSDWMTKMKRFWDKVDVKNKDECWPWIGATNPAGYGKLHVDGKFIDAHRMAYHIHYDEHPGNLLVCHSCDNPTCVNPHHLWLGTYSDNIRDSISKGRNRSKEVGVRLRKIKTHQVDDVLEMLRHMSLRAVSRHFKVSLPTVRVFIKRHNLGSIPHIKARQRGPWPASEGELR